MGINRVSPPGVRPGGIEDYTRQNKVLKNLMCFQNIMGQVKDDMCTIKRGSFFEYRGDMYALDSDHLLRMKGPFSHLIFNGSDLLLYESSSGRIPDERFDYLLNGYYEEDPEDFTRQMKYLGCCSIQADPIPVSGGNPFTNTTKIRNTGGFLTMKKPHLGDTYVRYPGGLHPESCFFGRWVNVSFRHAGNFFRAEGLGSQDDRAGTFGAGVQLSSIKAHTHSFSYNNPDTGRNRPLDYTPGSDPYFHCSQESRSNVQVLQTTTAEQSFGQTAPTTETRPVNITIQIYRCTQEVR